MQETKRRVWWTLVMADHWCSHGMGICRQLRLDEVSIDLPFDEKTFQNLNPGDENLVRSLIPRGFWAYKITLVQILGLIHDLNRQLMNNGISEASADREVDILGSRLDDWLTALPKNMQISDENFEGHRRSGAGGTFVALHLGFHHYSTLLYFQYLDQRRPLSELVEAHSQRCKHHAYSFARLLEMSRQRDRCEAVYATVGHMTVVSSSVLLHTLLFGRDEEQETARQLLTSNFSALIELKKLWPSLERTVSPRWSL